MPMLKLQSIAVGTLFLSLGVQICTAVPGVAIAIRRDNTGPRQVVVVRTSAGVNPASEAITVTTVVAVARRAEIVSKEAGFYLKLTDVMLMEYRKESGDQNASSVVVGQLELPLLVDTVLVDGKEYSCDRAARLLRHLWSEAADPEVSGQTEKMGPSGAGL